MGELKAITTEMRKIIFATNNQHKTQEVQQLLEGQYEVLNLKDINCDADIEETGSSFAANAEIKARYVVDHFQMDCFADDSGLEVDALHGAPGIYSARYSGNRDDRKNLQLVLQKLEGESNRRARFKTVVALVRNGQTELFEGLIEGIIRTAPSGDGGFGYDPIFQPDGYDVTFAEMSMAEKNSISHRALAMKKLISFLQAQ